jgi:MarR family protein
MSASETVMPNEGLLTRVHWRLLAHVSRQDLQRGWVRVSQADLAKLWGKSRETINRAFRDLVAWGYLDQLSQQTAHNRWCAYRVVIDPMGEVVDHTSRVATCDAGANTFVTCDAGNHTSRVAACDVEDHTSAMGDSVAIAAGQIVDLVEQLGSDHGLGIDRPKLLSARQIRLLHALLIRYGTTGYMEAVEHVLVNRLWTGRCIDSWLYFAPLVGMPTRRACETAAKQQFPDPAVILYEADAANVLSLNLFIDERGGLDVFLLSAAIVHSDDFNLDDATNRWNTIGCTQAEVLAVMVDLLRSVTIETRQGFNERLVFRDQVSQWFAFSEIVCEVIQGRRREKHADADQRGVRAK